MLKYCDSTRLRKYFGHFGGSDAISDFEFGRLNPDVDKIRGIIESDAFEAEFRRILPLVCDKKPAVERTPLKDGRVLCTAPALAGRYNLAAQLAYARMLGKSAVGIGTYRDNILRLAAAACQTIGLGLNVTLSKKQSQDASLIAALRSHGAKVDGETCARYFDLPYAYFEPAFAPDPAAYAVPVEANYGVFPKPALTGVFAGLYGADLLDALGKTPEACVVPITTGTEAVGAFKALIHTDCALATSEEPIAQEFHLVDTGTYTLSTRSANAEEPNTTICPELASWWRRAKVMRLGCDCVYPVDTAQFDALGMSAAAARAAALAFEATGCGELLVLEVPV